MSQIQGEIMAVRDNDTLRRCGLLLAFNTFVDYYLLVEPCLSFGLEVNLPQVEGVLLRVVGVQRRKSAVAAGYVPR